MVGAVRRIHPFVEDVDSTAGSRREESDLVNVWVGVSVHGVFCTVFLGNPTSSPTSSPSYSPSSPPRPTTSASSATAGLPSLGIWFRRRLRTE